MSDKKRKLAERIARCLHSKGYTAYFAGGCVRDLIMRRSVNDYDIATNAEPDEVESLFPKTVPVGKAFGVVRVILDKETFEVATFRKEADYADGRHPSRVTFASPEIDAKRRDFTVNGLFYDPVKRRVIDFVKGRDDIRRRVIRAIGEPRERFSEDYLRLLRAIRFASSLNFTIEKKTWKAITENSSAITRVSAERIREELTKMFTRRGAGLGLRLLAESGLLKQILPEVDTMRGVKQPEEFHPEGDVFVHTALIMDLLRSPSVELAFAALLHDVGKPPTFSVTDRIHFYEHSEVGGRMTEKILKRLRFSNKEIDAISAIVENHMRFMHVKKMREGKLKNLMARPTFFDELELHRIDCKASHGDISNWYFLKSKFKKYKEIELRPKPLVSGDDLIKEGYEPGPYMGEILRALYDEQLDGHLKSKSHALRWIRKNFPRKGKP
ncbi:MAG: CCA tRNA nucleotidyltransferase [Candidatus Omnitrophica bacterium]|nr:CCA tRNA nucleotidyltransferase [Candidatus Omnitrophota bacterium]